MRSQIATQIADELARDAKASLKRQRTPYRRACINIAGWLLFVAWMLREVYGR